jgi:hypothetical protein
MIAILAGTREEFEEHVDREMSSTMRRWNWATRNDYKYIHNPDLIRGMVIEDYVVVGTFMTRPNAAALLDAVQMAFRNNGDGGPRRGSHREQTWTQEELGRGLHADPVWIDEVGTCGADPGIATFTQTETCSQPLTREDMNSFIQSVYNTGGAQTVQGITREQLDTLNMIRRKPSASKETLDVVVIPKRQKNLNETGTVYHLK